MDADKAIDLLLDDIEGLNEHVVDESERRIKRRMPVDTGKAKRSVFSTEEGVFSDDDSGKMMALEYGHSNQAPLGMWRVTIAEIPQMIDQYMKKFQRTPKKKRGKR